MRGARRIEARGAKRRRRSDFESLSRAFAELKNAKEVSQFLKDLATPAELEAFAERWRIALLLDDGDQSYRDIAAVTGASTTTIARVARYLREEPHQGYRLIIDRIRKSTGKAKST